MTLAAAVCKQQAWDVIEVRFYTGVPDRADDAFWHHFWTNKLAQIGRRGAAVYSRSLVYRNRVVRLPDGSEHSYLTGEEKGIDVRLGIDIISTAWQSVFDVALVFSQDQDLSEVARGIDWTDWIRIDRATDDACLDPRDYRPKAPSATGGSP